MTGLPVIIRLIDPPLHEFMPDEGELLEEVIANRIKKKVDQEKEDLLVNIQGLHESNPMMGLRGVRSKRDDAGNRQHAGPGDLRSSSGCKAAGI